MQSLVRKKNNQMFFLSSFGIRIEASVLKNVRSRFLLRRILGSVSPSSSYFFYLDFYQYKWYGIFIRCALAYSIRLVDFFFLVRWKFSVLFAMLKRTRGAAHKFPTRHIFNWSKYALAWFGSALLVRSFVHLFRYAFIRSISLYESAF